MTWNLMSAPCENAVKHPNRSPLLWHSSNRTLTTDYLWSKWWNGGGMHLFNVSLVLTRSTSVLCVCLCEIYIFNADSDGSAWEFATLNFNPPTQATSLTQSPGRRWKTEFLCQLFDRNQCELRGQMEGRRGCQGEGGKRKEGWQEKRKESSSARTMVRLQSSSEACQVLNNSPTVITTRDVAILLFYTLTTHTYTRHAYWRKSQSSSIVRNDLFAADKKRDHSHLQPSLFTHTSVTRKKTGTLIHTHTFKHTRGSSRPW